MRVPLVSSSSTTMAEEFTKFELHVPTPADFQGMAVLQTNAFHHHEASFFNKEKQKSRCVENYRQTYTRYHRECPHKIDICRIIKCPNDNAMILAACQLMTRKQRDSKTEVFVEWIACQPDHRGRGIGSQLLKWAATFSKKILKVKVLSLYVVQTNLRAIRLYERHGFVVEGKENNLKESQGMTLQQVEINKQKKWSTGKLRKLFTGLTISPFRNWSIHHMEKDLTDLKIL